MTDRFRKNGEKLRVERAGRVALEHRLLASGYQVAEAIDTPAERQ